MRVSIQIEGIIFLQFRFLIGGPHVEAPRISHESGRTETQHLFFWAHIALTWTHFW